jgi:hypothetical protein
MSNEQDCKKWELLEILCSYRESTAWVERGSKVVKSNLTREVVLLIFPTRRHLVVCGNIAGCHTWRRVAAVGI